jgi:hypothetical protein
MLSLCVVNCSQTPVDQGPEQAKQIANAYLAQRRALHPSVSVRVEDRGDKWVVIYDAPERMAGGQAGVWVDKRSMAVTDFVSSQ